MATNKAQKEEKIEERISKDANVSVEDVQNASSPEQTGVQRGYVNPDLGSDSVTVGGNDYLPEQSYELPLDYYDLKDAFGLKLFRKERG